MSEKRLWKVIFRDTCGEEETTYIDAETVEEAARGVWARNLPFIVSVVEDTSEPTA